MNKIQFILRALKSLICARRSYLLHLFCVLFSFGSVEAEGTTLIETFRDGASTWKPLASGWSVVETSPDFFVYRGDSGGDTLTRKTNIVLEGSWSVVATVDFKGVYAEGGHRGVASLALFPTNSGGVQLLATITHLSDGSARIDIAWYDKTNTVWRGVLNSGWMTGSSSSYRVELARIAGSDRLYLTAVASSGLSYHAESEPIPLAFLDSMKVPGLRANYAQVDFAHVVIATPIPERNQVLALDGAGDYVSIPSSAALQNPTGMSIECWLNPRVSNNILGSIINKGDGLAGNSARSYELRWTADETITTSFFLAPVAGQPDFISVSAPVQSNRWTHIAVAFDSLSGAARLLTNGVIAAEWEEPGSSLVGRELRQTTQPLVLGWTPTHSGTYAAGWVDEVRIWSRARSSVEVRADLACKLSGVEPGLVGYWNFDDLTANDQTGHGHDGALSGDARAIVRATADMALIGCDPAVFLSGQRDAAGLQWHLRGRIGSSYLIRSSTDLSTWEDFAPLEDAAVFQFEIVPTMDKAFFRAVLRP